MLNAIPAVFMSFRVLLLLLLHFQNTRKSLEISKTRCVVFVVTFPFRYTADNCHLFVIAARKEMTKKENDCHRKIVCFRPSVCPSIRRLSQVPAIKFSSSARFPFAIL